MNNSPSSPKQAKISDTTTSNAVRPSRTNALKEPTKSSTESSFKLTTKKRAGYCAPTQSTLHRRAQVQADKELAMLSSSGKGKSPVSISRKGSNLLPQIKSVPATHPAQKVAQASQKKSTSTRLVCKVVPVSEAKPATSTHPVHKTISSSGIKPAASARHIQKDSLPVFPKKRTGNAEALPKSSSLESEGKPGQEPSTFKKTSPECQDLSHSAILLDEDSFDSPATKKAKFFANTQSPSDSESTQSECESELSEVSSHMETRDLGPGFIQYLTPVELEQYHAYHSVDPEEQQAMIDCGKVDAADMDRYYHLEHIFDHLPVPGRDFEPVTTETLPEMFLDPALRGIFLEEKSRKLDLSYMDHQRFTFETRSRIVEMMAGILHDSCWRRDTFLMAVNLLDTVLSKGQVRGPELVIYSLCCILIATKLNERLVISADILISVMDEPVDVEKMERAEMNILNFLKFDVYCIPSHQFLIRISFYDKFNKHIVSMAKFFLEVSLFEITLVTELPSRLAAACYALARRILVTPEWTIGHHYYSGYTLEELEPIIETILDVIDMLPMNSNICIRYNSSRHHFVSHTVFSLMCPDYDVITGFKS